MVKYKFCEKINEINELLFLLENGIKPLAISRYEYWQDEFDQWEVFFDNGSQMERMYVIWNNLELWENNIRVVNDIIDLLKYLIDACEEEFYFTTY